MGSRVPLEHYGLRSTSSFDDLNSDRDTVAGDDLDNDGDAAAVDCMHDSYQASLPLHDVGVGEESASLENNGNSSRPCTLLTVNDISPIESARARFLRIVVDHFIVDHVIEVADQDTDYHPGQVGEEKLSKRKPREVHYEGDPRFALPQMYVANMYETLVNDVNIRLASLSGLREKTIGVALEASGGLYRSLAKKFPKKGPYTYRRRELATSVETRARFPELVIQEEKRVRFVVINGLDIVEKPNGVSIDDAEWFKRLTGRDDVTISPQDYKFYSPRHKQKRGGSNSTSQVPGLVTFSDSDNSAMDSAPGFRSITDSPNQQAGPSKHHTPSMSHQPQFHPMPHTPVHQEMHQSPQASHFPHNMSDITHPHHSQTMQHMTCLPPLVGAHMGGGRMHVNVMPASPAKFCDLCGAPYLRETSKFCSECGVKRLGT